MSDPHRLIRLGVFGAPQGVRGEVRVKAYTGEPKAIAAYGPLTDAKGAKRFAIRFVRPLKDDMIVVRVDGVATRDDAQSLTGVELYARRDQLPPPAEDEFYYDDLIGLAAETPEGEALGRVAGLVNYGAGDILEVAPEGGGETRLYPFTKSVAVEIDFVRERIVLNPPNEIADDSKPD